MTDERDSQFERPSLVELYRLACRGGDREIHELLLRSALLIARAVRSILRHEEDREDVVQRVLMKAVGSLGTLRGPEAYPTWLWRVSTRTAIDAVRGTRPEVCCTDFETLPDRRVAAPFIHAILCEEVELLKARIARLPRIYRRVVGLAALDGMTPAEIASALGLTEEAVRSRLRRGRVILGVRRDS